jgi:hypothetical protein
MGGHYTIRGGATNYTPPTRKPINSIKNQSIKQTFIINTALDDGRMTKTCSILLFQKISIYWKTEAVTYGYNILLVIQHDAKHKNENHLIHLC